MSNKYIMTFSAGIVTGAFFKGILVIGLLLLAGSIGAYFYIKNK